MPEKPTEPANGRARRPNGRANGITFWTVSAVVGGDVEISIESENGTDLGLTVCSKCAGLVPSSETSQQLHRNWHEAINGIDSRTS